MQGLIGGGGLTLVLDPSPTPHIHTGPNQAKLKKKALLTGDMKLYNEKKAAEILAYAERHEALRVCPARSPCPTSPCVSPPRLLVVVF